MRRVVALADAASGEHVKVLITALPIGAAST
jgi:hypothetical protein